VLRLPRKMTTEISKMLRLPRKLQLIILILLKQRKSNAPATQNDFRRAIKQVGMSQSAAPATQNDMATCSETFKRFKKDMFCSFPQTPRVKREPLLHIREK